MDKLRNWWYESLDKRSNKGLIVMIAGIVIFVGAMLYMFVL